MATDLLENAVEIAASETMQWWENACGDMGYGYEESLHDADSKAAVAFEQFKKVCDNVEYAKEAMADWFHSDVDSIMDCCGDHIFDHAMQIKSNPAGFAKHLEYDAIFVMICEKIKATTHGEDIQGAMTRMIVQHSERLKARAK